MNIIEIFKLFPSQEHCIKHLEKVRWGNNKAICPYCKSSHTYTHKEKNKIRKQCYKCHKAFSVTVGTIFHSTKLPLQKWFLAISMILNAKKGISSRQLARDLDIEVKTAWSISHKIRNAMINDNDKLVGIIEMDETYINVKSKDKKDDDDKNSTGNKRGRGTNKTSIIGMVEKNGNIIAKVSKKLDFKTLKWFIDRFTRKDISTYHTDEYKGYKPLKRHGYKHKTVNHSVEFTRGNININTIEGFWGLLKRGITGQYHYLSDKYLNQYIQEFCFKYNNRKNVNLFNSLIDSMVGVSINTNRKLITNKKIA